MIKDVQKEFRELVTITEAKRIIQQLDIRPCKIEMDIKDTQGRVLAGDVVSEVDVPPFDRSSMDGFAVHAPDTYHAREDRPVQLKVVGSIPAGVKPDIQVNAGEAAEISTGAVMPSWADAVVMVEYTNIDNDTVSILRPVSINENVMHAGSDIMAGERVLKKGTILGEREIGVLAAVGKEKVGVSLLKVGIISTGDELQEQGHELKPGMIYDINSFSIAAGVKECGGTPIAYGIVRDEEEEMSKILERASRECDIILTSGSTSAGSGDIMYRLIEEKGIVLAHGIDIKPGKPAVIGKVSGKPIFGLPGYPASALTIFNEFVAPLIRKSMGKREKYLKEPAKLASRVRSEGRSQLLPVGLVRGWAYPIEKGSGAITTLAEADGFIEIPGNVEIIEAGEIIDVTLFGKVETPDLLFVGSNCLGLDTLSGITNLKVRAINAGSTGGLMAIRNGNADIAGVHLLDETGIYNVPFLKKFGIENALIVKGYLREQGLMVKRGSNIRKFEDILSSRIINRNTGSGTRVLTDLKLKEICEKEGISFEELTGNLKGYLTEARTHSAIASAVRLGKADVGIGIRTVAEMNGLEFIKIADEEYDFVLPLKIMGTIQVKRFIESLRSREFREKLPPGLKVYERTGEIVRISG